jgi:hypothetical protein
MEKKFSIFPTQSVAVGDTSTALSTAELQQQQKASAFQQKV